MSEEDRGPWFDAVDAANEDLQATETETDDEAEDQSWGERQHEELAAINSHLRSYDVAHAHHRVKRPGATIHLDSEEPHTTASVTLHADPDKLHDKPPVSLHVKTTDNGMEEGLTTVDMTIAEFEDLHERMGKALEAAKDGARYYER